MLQPLGHFTCQAATGPGVIPDRERSAVVQGIEVDDLDPRQRRAMFEGEYPRPDKPDLFRSGKQEPGAGVGVLLRGVGYERAWLLSGIWGPHYLPEVAHNCGGPGSEIPWKQCSNIVAGQYDGGESMMRWIAVSLYRRCGNNEGIILGHRGQEGVYNGLVQGAGHNKGERE